MPILDPQPSSTSISPSCNPFLLRRHPPPSSSIRNLLHGPPQPLSIRNRMTRVSNFSRTPQNINPSPCPLNPQIINQTPSLSTIPRRSASRHPSTPSLPNLRIFPHRKDTG